MRVRMRLVGSGTPDDPFKVRHPHHMMISCDYAAMTAIVDIPDRVAPDDVDAPGSPLRPVVNGAPVVVGLRVAQRLAYAAKLKRLFDPLIGQIDTDGIV